ncbi:site-specific DNA-methyltransferase [Paenibacillus alvei]|uniref:DNA-methyltransferase n=1 Tax=Paenibacillus alvei TaxID=44250 RepID=UPI0002881261|nr:DNA methyltransferase [Paenibacillus alvei]EJW16921.1 DNA methylase N-4/N-6 [Paenibacillus alvei DSM 29]EJW19918.1 DNA modification methylase [Paenibacillus alvei DSM 29]MCY9543261.1 site-specific DNA-methyltransferase [Paenibacillus alvei]MCY9708482.1 site-specific DNA-methyltransferase [Paenibacillus alvei]MCY9732205.1 site-specific DNA-methyltransferase [Paenibacillus alvei]
MEIKHGSIFKLGRHRLMCGDSTLAQDVAKLMDGQQADMCFTDPPYAAFGSSNGMINGIVDTKMVEPFMRAVLGGIKSITKDFAHIYVCCDYRSYPAWRKSADVLFLPLKNLIVWVKTRGGGLGSHYTHCHEFVMFFHREPDINKIAMKDKKSGARRVNGRGNVWFYNKVIRKLSEKLHNAEKPLQMVIDAIENSSDKGDMVVDLFGGSGTTLIASEQTERVCYMMEVEPENCLTIIKRWEQETGEKAEVMR